MSPELKEKVERLCEKALNPISSTILNALDLNDKNITTGAVCVYHHLVSHAKKHLNNKNQTQTKKKKKMKKLKKK